MLKVLLQIHVEGWPFRRAVTHDPAGGKKRAAHGGCLRAEKTPLTCVPHGKAS